MTDPVEAASRRRAPHGSDWSVISLQPPQVGLRTALRLMTATGNWVRRDALTKRPLGLGDDHFDRAETILRLPLRSGTAPIPVE